MSWIKKIYSQLQSLREASKTLDWESVAHEVTNFCHNPDQSSLEEQSFADDLRQYAFHEKQMILDQFYSLSTIDKVRDCTFFLRKYFVPPQYASDPDLYLMLKYIPKEAFAMQISQTLRSEKDLKADCIRDFLKQSEHPDRLTIYHDAGHAFVNLQCASCNDGNGAVVTAGFYNTLESEQAEEGSFDPLLEKFFDFPLDQPFFSFGIHGFLSINAWQRGLHSAAPSVVPFMKTGYYTKELMQANNLHHMEDRYFLFLEGLRYSHDKHQWLDSTTHHGYDMDNIDSKSFDITAEAAKKIFDTIAFMSNHCDKDRSYRVLTYNCLDFVQEMYELAKLPGHHMDAIHDHSYPIGKLSAYKIYSDLRDWWAEDHETGVV